MANPTAEQLCARCGHTRAKHETIFGCTEFLEAPTSKKRLFDAIVARHTPRCHYNANCQVCELIHDMNVRPVVETPAEVEEPNFERFAYSREVGGIVRDPRGAYISWYDFQRWLNADATLQLPEKTSAHEVMVCDTPDELYGQEVKTEAQPERIKLHAWDCACGNCPSENG